MARPLKTISALDADKWCQGLRRQGLAQATTSKRIKTARQILRQGVKWRMLTENPFDGIKAGPQHNRARQCFITRADAMKVLEACPDAEWRVIFALSRFGGLRCPSETLALRWQDIDWLRGRILIRSSKTEGYEHGGRRELPMFPELKTYLLELFHQVPPGTEYVITRYRDPGVNLRTQFQRILERAGLVMWPKPFHNLRASRQTELAEHHPIHVVCAWLGNSTKVALTHYLQVRDSDFQLAIAGTETCGHLKGSACAV